MANASIMRGRILTKSGKSPDLEQAWRPLIPVDSFVREPVELKSEVKEPDVGIRWGKPSDFDFELPEKQRRKRSPMEVREVPRYYFENEIVDFTEEWRKFRYGDVIVHAEEDLPEYNQGTEWQAYIEQILALAVPDDPTKVEVEELQSWIADSGISWTRLDSNGDPVANVTVYYEFEIGNYIPFHHEPQPKFDERGERPE